MRVSNNSTVIEWIHPVNETKMETHVNELEYWTFNSSSRIEKSELLQLHERIFFVLSNSKQLQYVRHIKDKIFGT